MKKLFKFILSLTLACAPSMYAQKPNLLTDTQGVLPGARGGTGNTSPGTFGQVLIGDGAGHFAPGDPIVSFNFANLNTIQPATAQVVGTPVRLSTFGASGTLYVTFASITGSGTSCTVQLKNYDSLGNGVNSGAAISVTPTNGTTTSAVSPALALQTAAQMSATYSCSAYPTGGSVTVEFVPGVSVGIAGQIAISNFPAFPATQPVSAVSLPLPAGAATSANQPALVAGRTPVDPSGVTSPVSAASLPLPAGAATSANQPALVSGRTPVDPSGVTSPVSAASLPLPTGASTAAKQPALGTAGTPSVDVISVQGATSMTALKVDPSAVTSPVSAASLPLPAGAATSANQPALVSGRTPVDPSGVTSPVSAASLPLPAGASTSANQSAVKASSTAAVATDTSSVVQISPNQPQLTTPLNAQGAKTNNNAAPGATNFGTLPALANAAPPAWTEGNQVHQSQDLGGNTRVYSHPPAVIGCYVVNGRTSTYAALAAGAPLFSFRWADATHIAIINHVKVQVIATVAATVAGQAERELIIARSFSVSDTGGTAVTLTGNNQKMRTSQGTSLVTDMRFGTTITPGTRTLDANPIASAVAWLPLNMTGVDIGCSGASPTSAVWSCVSSAGYIDLLNTANGQDYPLVLATNEGFIVRVGKDAMPTTAVQQTYLTVSWCEASSY